MSFQRILFIFLHQCLRFSLPAFGLELLQDKKTQILLSWLWRRQFFSSSCLKFCELNGNNYHCRLTLEGWASSQARWSASLNLPRLMVVLWPGPSSWYCSTDPNREPPLASMKTNWPVVKNPAGRRQQVPNFVYWNLATKLLSRVDQDYFCRSNQSSLTSKPIMVTQLICTDSSLQRAVLKTNQLLKPC